VVGVLVYNNFQQPSKTVDFVGSPFILVSRMFTNLLIISTLSTGVDVDDPRPLIPSPIQQIII
jgi:hypothetical protein